MHLLISLFLILPPQVAGWEVFADTKFKWVYADKFGMEVEVPIFTKRMKAMDGKEVTLTGHYLPMELTGERIIISKLPYASCFFCGGGVGQESVAEVQFNSVQRPFRMDELVTVKGRLKLNEDDFDHLVFILEDAEVIDL